MRTIINPTNEQIESALALVQESNCITNDCYAMTKFGTFLNHGNISTPKDQIRTVRYIQTYGTKASVSYVLEGIDMYPMREILKAGYAAIHQQCIPEFFENIATVIYEY